MTKKKTKDLAMKDQLLGLVTQMEGDGFNFEANAAQFDWGYGERPDILFRLAISKVKPKEDAEIEPTGGE